MIGKCAMEQSRKERTIRMSKGFQTSRIDIFDMTKNDTFAFPQGLLGEKVHEQQLYLAIYGGIAACKDGIARGEGRTKGMEF